MCAISSAKRATQKVEFRAVEEEKQEEVVVVEVPEPKPADQFREKPGIAVVATTLHSAFPILSPLRRLYMLVPDNSEKFHQTWRLSFSFLCKKSFAARGRAALGDLLNFCLAPGWTAIWGGGGMFRMYWHLRPVSLINFGGFINVD